MKLAKFTILRKFFPASWVFIFEHLDPFPPSIRHVVSGLMRQAIGTLSRQLEVLKINLRLLHPGIFNVIML